MTFILPAHQDITPQTSNNLAQYVKLPECYLTSCEVNSSKLMALYGTEGPATNYRTTQVRLASRANIRVGKMAERTGHSPTAKRGIGICDAQCNLDREHSFAVGTIVTRQLANVGVGCGRTSKPHP